MIGSSGRNLGIDSFRDALKKVPTSIPIYVDTCVLMFGGAFMLGDSVHHLQVSMLKDKELWPTFERYGTLTEAIVSADNFKFSSMVYDEFQEIQERAKRKIKNLRKDIGVLLKRSKSDTLYRPIMNLSKAIERKHKAFRKIMSSKVDDQPIDPLEMRLVKRLTEIYRFKEKKIAKGKIVKDTDEDIVLQAYAYARNSGKPVGVLTADLDVRKIFTLCGILFEDKSSPWYFPNAIHTTCYSFFTRSGLRTAGHHVPSGISYEGRQISGSEVLERAQKEMDILVR